MPLLYPEDLGDDLSKIRNQLKAALVLARSSVAKTKILTNALRVLGAVQIEQGGGLFLIDTTNATRSYLGQIDFGGGPYGHGLLIQKPSGDDVLAAWSMADGSGAFPVRDDGNAMIFGTDPTGMGFSRPFLRATPTLSRVTDWPSSVSATFETVMETWASPWQPSIRVYGAVYAPASTTAEARVLSNGTQVGATVTATNNAFGTIDFSAAIPGLTSATLENLIDIAELQIRRTAGTGTIRGVLQSVETKKSS